MRAPIALVDCNNFFASCDRVFDPKLRGKPIVVLSSNHGCVIARSNEAKALGIAMGEPWHPCKERIGTRGVIVRSSNYTLYGDMSARVMEVLSHFTPPCSRSIRSMKPSWASRASIPVWNSMQWRCGQKSRNGRESRSRSGLPQAMLFEDELRGSRINTLQRINSFNTL